MALQTKTIQGNDSLGRSYTLKLYLSEDSTSVTNNTSTISYSLTLYSGGWNYGQYGTGYNVYINGTRVAYCADNGIYTSISKNSSLSVCSGTTTVTHDSDGTKTISVSAYFGTSSSGAGTGDINISGTWALTAIPRESNVSLSNGTLGTAQNITIIPHVSTYKHTLKYTCGNASGTIASNLTGSTSGFTYSWTPPLSLAAQNTTGTSVSVKITCETYSGSTLIGSKDTTVTMSMPASIKPTVTATLSDNNGYASTYGAYIQNKSKLKVVLSITNSQGATTSSYSIKVGNRLTYSTYPSGGLVTDFLPESGSVAVQVTVTDSRGRSGSISATSITVAPYSEPSISSIGIYRSDSNGTASAAGTHATLTFKATVSPITVGSTNKNTATYKLQYKLSSSSSWTESTLTTYSNNYNVTNGKTTFQANVANSYDARITITDIFGTVTSVIVKVQSASTYFRVDVPNNALTLGRMETAPNTFRCGWEAIFDESVTATGKYNTFNYMPYSWVTRGGTTSSTGYARIATITITNGYVRGPIEFRVARREDFDPSYLYVRFSTTSSSDPTLSGFYIKKGRAYNSQISAFIVKTGTSIWDVYVEKTGSTDSITVTTNIPEYIQGRLNISYADNQLSSIPSGATEAITVPCLEPTVTITKTSGNSTASSVAFERSGNVCQLSFNITTSASISVGSNAFVGTTTAPKPIKAQTNASYYGSSVIITDFGANGTLTIRVNGASLASGAVAYCNVIYLTNE